MSQEDKPNQLVAIVGPDQILAIEVPRELLPNGLAVLTVVPESPTLPHGRLVENVRHTLDERLIEAGLPHNHSAFLCLPDVVPSVRPDLLVPPVVEASHREGRDCLRFSMELEVWFDVR